MQTKNLVGAAILGSMSGASLLVGEDPGRCVESYRTSGLTEVQMPFEEFSALYGGEACAPDVADRNAPDTAEAARGGAQPVRNAHV